MPKKYFILQTLWSVGEGRHLYPGERSDLADLSPEQIEKLTAGNVIMLNAPAKGQAAATGQAPADQPAADDSAADQAAPSRKKKGS